MSNELKDLMETSIMPLALPVLRESCVMARLIATDFAADIYERGQTISVPLPVDLGFAQDMDTVNGSQSNSLDPTRVNVTLDFWRYKSFDLSDKEMREAVAEGVLPGAVSSAIRSLANSVDTEIWNLYRSVPSFVGLAGVTPNAKDAIVQARKVLQDNLSPPQHRYLMLDTVAEAEYLALWGDVSKGGSIDTLEHATLGTKFGFAVFADQIAPTHTFGSFGAPGASPKILLSQMGSNLIDIHGGSGTETLRMGDVILIDGVQKNGLPVPFIVMADYQAAAGVINGVRVYPSLPQTVPLNANIKVVAPTAAGPNFYSISMAFQRDAFLYAARALGRELSENSEISTAIDPMTGIPMRLETWRDQNHGRRTWRFDQLFGAKCLRPDLACRLHG
jgi:hypothetical protein